MWKMGMSEAGIDAILGGSAIAGPELVAAEIAMMGMIIGIKKLKDHHQAKKQRKEDAKNADRVAEADRQAAEREEAKRQEDADVARRQAEADAQRQAEEQKAAEEARVAEDAKKQEELAQKAEADRIVEEQKAEERKQEEIVINGKRYEDYVSEATNQIMRRQDIDRQTRIARLEMQNGIQPQFIIPQGNAPVDRYQRYAPPDGPDGPDGPGGDPNDPNGGNPGGPGGDGGPGDDYDWEGNINRENQRMRNDPFQQIIDMMARQTARNAYNDKIRREQQDDNKELMPGENGGGIYNPDKQPEPGMGPNDNYPGKNGAGTYNPDKAKEAQNTNKYDYNDDLTTLEYQLTGIMEGLSQQELTLEDSYVQMEKIEQIFKDKVPDQVRIRPSAIFSSTISTF